MYIRDGWTDDVITVSDVVTVSLLPDDDCTSVVTVWSQPGNEAYYTESEQVILHLAVPDEATDTGHIPP